MASTGRMPNSQQDELRQDSIETALDRPKRRSSKTKESDASLVHKFVDEVSILGLSEAVKANHPCAKALWALVFLTCLGTGTYFVYMVLSEYFQDPTATKVGLIRMETYSFPPMALCVDTWLNAEKAMKIGLTKESIEFAMSYLVAPYDLMRDKLPHKSNSTSARAEFEQVYQRENFTNLIHFFNYISLDAKWRAEDDGIEFDCLYCARFQLPKIILDHDVCYLIDLTPVQGRGLRQSYGWHEMVLHVPDLSRGIQDRKSYWRLYVNPLMSKLVSSGQFISIETGHMYSLQMEAVRYQMLNKEEEPCIDEKDRKARNYSAIGCSLDCVAKHFQMAYATNCTLFNLAQEYKKNLSEYCNTYHMDRWIHSPDPMVRAASYEFIMQCAAECLSECEMTRYETVADGHFSRHLMQNELKVNGEPRKHNATAAKVYFINANLLAGGVLTFSEVYTYSFETLVGNIGGTCGIWVGASTLTFIQVLTFWSKHCLNRGKKKVPIRSFTTKRGDRVLL